MHEEVDAIVIGAGVAGGAIACGLAEKGWRVVLLDKGASLRHKACGEFLSPESVSSLRALKLDSLVRSRQPATVTLARLHTERGISLELPLPGPAIGLSRHALDAVLQDAAAERGAEWRAASPATAVAKTDAGYRVDVRSKSGDIRLTARIAIGAWGRRPFGGVVPLSAASLARSYVGIKSHFIGAGDAPIVDLYFFRGGYIGISPIEDGRTNVAGLIMRSEFRNAGGTDAIERILREAARRVPALAERLSGMTPVPGTQAAASPVGVRWKPLAWDGLPLVGDAAAAIPPFCGDGMAMALRSAELGAVLADAYLRGDCTLAEWKVRYSRQIRRQFGGALRWGSLLEYALAKPRLADGLLRLGAFAPGMAARMVRATRLKG
ncbi:FAD-dependent oxidoreductase [Paenibacillaceae bacterium WGS1546]|uniref:FAD-dependent oxidoreductase n=1 Tax=Cohnella sp. WGS1546 TaxID=3366810 RepID=UPI00372D1412